VISGLPPAQTTSKKILVVQYSQTGQLQAVADELLAPLRADRRFEIHTETLAPQKPFPFPWPFFRFFDAFPESAHMVPPPLKPLSLTGDERFDLVILPYQVWFLAPSQPITAFLKDSIAQRVLRGTPVVTVIACRNMWLLAHEKLKGLLATAGARLIDNVVLTDPGPTLATFITTPRWLLSGRKGPIWGMPAAGLNGGQIRGARRFGLALRDALAADRERGTAPLLAGLGAVQVDPKLYASEKAGSRSFYLWGHLLRAAGAPGSWQRVPLLALYVTFLVTAIIAVVPLSLAVQALLRPFMGRWLADIQQRFEQPSGSSTERCALYDQ
jgi:hypothetical protein